MDAKKVLKSIAWIITGESSLKPSVIPNPIQSNSYVVISLNQISQALQKSLGRIEKSNPSQEGDVLSLTWKPKKPNFAVVNETICISKQLTPNGVAQVTYCSSLEEAKNAMTRILVNNPSFYVIIEDPLAHTNTLYLRMPTNEIS